MQKRQGSQGCLPWLGWLACCALPWLGLAWACLACLALAWSSNNNSSGAAAAGGRRRPVVVAGPRQGRRDRPMPDQAKARHNKQASQAKAGWPDWLAGLAGWLDGRSEFWIFFGFFFGPQNGLKWCPRAPGRPGGYFPPIFRLFLGAPGGNFFLGPGALFSPLGALFSLSPISPFWAAALWEI